jgi:Domain of unknown function (DUF4157)
MDEASRGLSVSAGGELTRIPLWADREDLTRAAASPGLLGGPEPGDPREQAADQIASHVLAQTGEPASGESSPANAPAAGPRPRTARGEEPLPLSLRAPLEPAFGRDLGGIRLHTDTAADRRAQLQSADAITEGEHISFAAGQFRPDSADGLRLLLHEVAHAVEPEAGSRIGGVYRQGHPPQTQPSLAQVLPLLDTAVNAMEDIYQDLQDIQRPSDALIRAIGDFITAKIYVREEALATHAVADLLTGRITREALLANRPLGLDSVVRFYTPGGERYPRSDRIRLRAEQLQQGFRLAALVRERVVNLTRTPPTDPDTPVVRRIQHDLAALYLSAATIPQQQGFARVAFLDAYYQDPDRLNAYGVAQFVRDEVPMLWTNLRESIGHGQGAVLEPAIPGRVDLPGRASDIPDIMNERDANVVALSSRAAEQVLRLKAWADQIGPLPASLAEVRRDLPTAAEAGYIARILRQLYIETAVIALWQWKEPLNETLRKYLYIGQTFWTGNDAQRTGWLNTIRRLDREFGAEVSTWQHPDKINERLDGWQKDIKTLYDEIVPQARRAEIIAKIAEQIPMLIVTSGASLAVGAWMAETWAASRWLVPLTMLAEGATVTAINVLAQLPSGQVTAGGVAISLATNIAFSGLGRLIFAPASATAQGLSATRRAIMALKLAGGLAALSSAQATAQLIERQVTQQGGESDWTQVLTVNLVTNALGLLFGVSLQPGARPGGRPATTEQLALASGLDPKAAREYAALAARTEQLDAMTRDLRAATAIGRVKPADIDAWKSRGLQLLDDIEARLPDLVQRLGLEQKPADIHAAVARYRALFAAVSSTPARPVLLLPEYTPGLTPSGTGSSWVTTPGADPNAGAIGRLRASWAERPGVTVRELPGRTGWEAVDDATGMIVVQVMVPAVGARVPALPPSLDVVAGASRDAQAGVEAVRTQTVWGALAARLAEASLSPQGAARVARLLGIAGRVARAAAAPAGIDPASDAALRAQAGTDVAAAAIDAALSDPGAEAGLDRLATRFGPRYPVALASILVCVEPPGMLGALRAFGDPAFTGLSVEFYQALGRNPMAQDLVNRFGGSFLLRLVNLRPERSLALRLSRSAPDIERVWLGLTVRQGRTEQQMADLAARTGRLRTLGGLDPLFGARPQANVQIEALHADPNWPDFLREARRYAAAHPPKVGGAYTPEEMELRAALLQTVERARNGEFDTLSPMDQESLLQDFDRVALTVRLERGWINVRRSQVHEAMSSPQSRSVWIVWRNRVPLRRVVKDSTIPDGAFPPVRAGETPAELLRPREWLEQKTDLIDEGHATDGVIDAGRRAANEHLSGARADLDENLPVGSTIAVDYLRDPGEPTRGMMLGILFREPRIVRVRFRGTTYERDPAGGYRVGRWPGD